MAESKNELKSPLMKMKETEDSLEEGEMGKGVQLYGDTKFLVQVMTNLDNIFKSRDITLPTKVRLVKAMVFPVVMYGCESWTINKGERRRIDAFELWCWRRLSRVPWIAKRSNQSILKEISPGCSLEGLMLKQNSNTFAT